MYLILLSCTMPISSEIRVKELKKSQIKTLKSVAFDHKMGVRAILALSANKICCLFSDGDLASDLVSLLMEYFFQHFKLQILNKKNMVFGINWKWFKFTRARISSAFIKSD